MEAEVTFVPFDLLTRPEWLEVILRLARAKHLPVGASAEGAMATAVKDLLGGMKQHLANDAKSLGDDSAAADLRDEWRLRDFYQEPADKVFRRWQGRLEGVFRERMPADGGSGMWRLLEWQELLADSGLLEDSAFG